MSKEIEPKLSFIGDYLNLRSELFIIPEYQREYSWDTARCDKLWQDVEAFIEKAEKEPYFFGTIIADCSGKNKISLIDGQQRTTTFLLLLKALLIVLTEKLKKFAKDDANAESLKMGLKKSQFSILEILYNADDDKTVNILRDFQNAKGVVILENESINELDDYKNDFQKIMEAENYDKAESNVYKIPRKQKDNKYTNYFRNFKFFYEKLNDYSESQINVFAKKFLKECQIIEIRSWDFMQAIEMFNSLNSTGMPLSDANIISAMLNRNAKDKKCKFNEKWRGLIEATDELERNKIVEIDNILQQFMYVCRAKDGKTDATTPGIRKFYMEIKKELLAEPLDLCENFTAIAKIWDKIRDYPTIKLFLKFNENAKLFLISYLYRLGLENVSENEILPFTECLLRLFAVLEIVETGYSSKFFKIFLFNENAKIVRDEISIDEIQKDFGEHISKSWKREEIKKSLCEYGKNVLVFLNEYLYAKSHNLPFDFAENVNVEHIMPASGHNIDTIRADAKIEGQEEFDFFANSLGNKILLEENINKSIGNEWFKTKKQNSVKDKKGYKDSKYGIAKSLVNYQPDLWTKDAIAKATEKVAERICDFIFGT